MQHPNVHAAWSDWSESQTLHVIAVYNNPLRFRNRRELFLNFIRHMQASANVALHVVELQYGDRPFEMNPEVALRTRDILWHKENLINIGVSRLPADAKYIAYWDGDFHPTRHDWALEAIHQLQLHDFVQLFSGYSFMSADHRPLRNRPSFAYAFREYHGGDSERHIAARLGNAGYSGADEYAGGEYAEKDANPKPPEYIGAPGGGWAFTREAFSRVGGMLDECILGAADWYMAFGLIGYTRSQQAELAAQPGPYTEAIYQWQERAFESIKGNIGYVSQFATHGWHGDVSKRAYGTRRRILQEHDFNPREDLSRDWQGLLQWRGNKPRMRDAVQRYFTSRDEDSSELLSDPLI